MCERISITLLFYLLAVLFDASVNFKTNKKSTLTYIHVEKERVRKRRREKTSGVRQ